MGINPNTILQTSFNAFRLEYDWLIHERAETRFHQAPRERRLPLSTLQRYLRGCRLYGFYDKLQETLVNSNVRISIKDYDCLEPRSSSSTSSTDHQLRIDRS